MGCPRYAMGYCQLDIRFLRRIRNGTKRNLEMGVSWHEMIPLLVSTFNHDPDKRDQGCFYLDNLFKEPKAHIRRDLIVPRPTGMQFTP